ncbi:MAG: hypothetical protein HQL43_15920 [Alphaproteobacteria bacterium]|nr:hypothetical protein [Alphaproteobacteria bacterium]
MIMNSATSIDLEATAEAYNLRHLDWEVRLAAEAERLSQARPDLILANIPYLTIAVAKRLGVPVIGLSSLNWFDLYQSYLGHRPEAPGILKTILEAHSGAKMFLKLAPCLTMERLAEVTELKCLGPSARIGRKDPSGLRSRLGIADGGKLGLIAYGGVANRLPVENWPAIKDWTWLIPKDWGVDRADFRPFEGAGMGFPDVLASSDMVLTKPGYGTYTEAACNGVAVLAQERPDWPETPPFDTWMGQHARYATLPEGEILGGRIQGKISELMSLEPPACPQPTGIAEASSIILKEMEKLQGGL